MKLPLILVIFFSLFFSAHSWSAQKSVLLISSYHQSFPWTQQCEDGVKEVLSTTVSLDTFFMNTKQLPESAFQERADLAWQKYQASKPDLVMLGDDNALRLLGPRLAEEPVPVVFLGINHNPRVYFSGGILPPNMTGVLERTPIMGTIRFVSRVLPGVKRILLLAGESQTSQAELKNTLLDQKKLATTGIVADVKTVSTWAGWIETLKTVHKHYDIVLPLAYFNIKDENGKYLSASEAIAAMSAASQIPIIVNQDYTVGDDGAMGALVIQGRTHGRRAGLIVLSILEGASPLSMLPEIDQTVAVYFNQRQLERFGITLPEDIVKHAIFK
ncbi:ABC transporter substrate-binding protein [Alkalimarinus coralli]|uniref:ABC transporter substrate-binding protein n=1 Tax=Alkalimarinus coralli TaxID=2935863 RepID=UPI00202B65EC|nr:ABC transporter substrate binding protein [Alkalimarinus coralli]